MEQHAPPGNIYPAVADHLKAVDRVNRLVWASSTLAEYDAAVEAGTKVDDADVALHAFATGGRYLRLEPVAFKGGRRALVFAVTGTGHEFIRTYATPAPAIQTPAVSLAKAA